MIVIIDGVRYVPEQEYIGEVLLKHNVWIDGKRTIVKEYIGEMCDKEVCSSKINKFDGVFFDTIYDTLIQDTAFVDKLVKLYDIKERDRKIFNKIIRKWIVGVCYGL